MPVSKPKLCRLADVVRYSNSEVIDRFCDAWLVSRNDAKKIFADLMRYLWLSVKAPQVMLRPVPIVDEMWHMFLVYTADYARWSKKYFGIMMTHQPMTTADKRKMERDARKHPVRFQEQSRRVLEQEIACVYDNLGEGTALRWYVSYPTRYGGQFFETQRRSAKQARTKLPAALVRRAARYG